jgi:hypothetical protein
MMLVYQVFWAPIDYSGTRTRSLPRSARRRTTISPNLDRPRTDETVQAELQELERAKDPPPLVAVFFPSAVWPNLARGELGER